ncbi:glycine cleavage system aminomethyltransferase GcvT [Pirellulales bacterium]|nr:glycine cleavage system aminomethyltransferase GcvT [Pirellulales bacterium]
MPATAPTLSQTPLFDWHQENDGRIVDFAGWAMPVQYASIVAEHEAVRTAAGMFDVSHMGQLDFRGEQAGAWLDGLLTRRVVDMKPGEIRYSLVCNAEGGILDDVLVYRLDNQAAGHDAPGWKLVVNASNRAKIVAHLHAHGDDNASLADATHETAMIAVQGPQAIARCRSLIDCDASALGNFRGAVCNASGNPAYVSRTGYTGEDGIELIVGADNALPLWNALAGLDIPACGLAARDTLRLEAAMPLYGHELSEQINPWQAGLRFAVNVQDRDFIGRDALVQLKDDARQPQRIGLEVEGRRPAREGSAVLLGDDVVGLVTSGTHSPTLGRPIAMAYVEPRAAAVGQSLAIDIRGKHHHATAVKLPFYRR